MHPVYVVGPASASCLQATGLQTIGSECGNAQDLADLIISQHNSNNNQSHCTSHHQLPINNAEVQYNINNDDNNHNNVASTLKPLLFACGNIARETIPKRLKENEIPLECLTCYTTVPNQHFLSSFKQYLHNNNNNNNISSGSGSGAPDVIVFFSPSGVEFFLSSIEEMVVDFDERVQLVAIGRTTQSALQVAGKKVHGVAAKPNPQALLESIISLDLTAS